MGLLEGDFGSLGVMDDTTPWGGYFHDSFLLKQKLRGDFYQRVID